MKIRLLFLCAIFLCAAATKAQYNAPENMFWAFGDSAAVSFATGAPVAGATQFVGQEGSASVCNAAGTLLFYTEGTNVYNAAHTLMPHGLNISNPYGTYSTTQGAAIVPMPGVPDKYYVFSLGTPYGGGSDPSCKLTYSIVDMALDGGLGDVDTAGIALDLADSLGEKMVTVRGNDCNIWLIVHRRSMPAFMVYEINPAGISSPTVYSFGGYGGTMLSYGLGAIKVSPDRQKLASQSQSVGTTGRTELYDFNAATGAISNPRMIDSGAMFDPYGVEFSDDNTKLYSFLTIFTGSTFFSRVWQYDLSLPTLTDISASRTTIATYSSLMRRDLKLGPDNKIYVCNPAAAPGFLDCIPNPNLAGTACGYITNAIPLGSGACFSGLPNTVQVPPLHISITETNIHLCRPAEGYITLTPTAAGAHYRWHDGTTTPTHTVTTTGTYWVQVYNNCDVVADTFRVVLDTMPVIHAGNDTTINEGDEIVLTATPPGLPYIWSTGTTGDTIHVKTGGLYQVTAINELCLARDTVVVTVTADVQNITQRLRAYVYPTPAHDKITINAEGLQSTATICIYNATGMKVMQQQALPIYGELHLQLPVNNLPAGVYTLRIEDNAGGHIIHKVVVGN